MWRTIGTELGIDVDKLNAIEKDDENDGGRLKAVINGANPAPTREIMAKLLESAIVENAIAGMIMFCPPPPHALAFVRQCTCTCARHQLYIYVTLVMFHFSMLNTIHGCIFMMHLLFVYVYSSPIKRRRVWKVKFKNNPAALHRMEDHWCRTRHW